MAPTEMLTEMQDTILRYIQHYAGTHGRAPSYREIEAAAGLKTPSAVSYQVRNLEKMGLLTREPYIARSLQLTDEALSFLGKVRALVKEVAGVLRFPIAGDIGASTPVETGNGDFATYDDEETIAVDAALLPRRKERLFALRVRGNSMIDALVRDRDIVILEQATAIREGEMVAAWLRAEQELTLKHYFLEGETARLQPANPTMGPIYVPARNVDVQARVVAVLRPDAGSPHPPQTGGRLGTGRRA